MLQVLRVRGAGAGGDVDGGAAGLCGAGGSPGQPGDAGGVERRAAGPGPQEHRPRRLPGAQRHQAA